MSASARAGETPELQKSPQAPKKTGLVFHSIPSSLSSPPNLSSSSSLSLCVLSAYSLSILATVGFLFHLFPLLICLLLLFKRHFLVFVSSLANISLTSSFVQAPARVFRLGSRPLLSSLSFTLPRFSLHSYARARRFPAFRPAIMSASEDDTPLMKTNGKPGKLS